MTYLGGKEGEGTAQTIINQQPPHDSYIEPFAGHAAIARWKRPTLNTTLIDRDPDATAWLAENTNGNLHLLTADALEWLPAQHFSARTLIYCDPPYLIRSRAQPRSRYRFEMSLEDHERLLQILTQLPCMLQISAYADPLYSSYLRNWRHMTFQNTTRRGVATEHLWMSYPEPKALHTYTHLGADYRERERIKRKVTRWTSRLAALPRLERLALYSALSEEIGRPETPDRQN
jgi:site-specific DNA-adenine methylase